MHAAAQTAAEGWLTMDGAAAQRGVSDTVIRKLIDRDVLPSRQVIAHAPWMIRASDPTCDGVVQYVNQVRSGRAHQIADITPSAMRQLCLTQGAPSPARQAHSQEYSASRDSALRRRQRRGG